MSAVVTDEPYRPANGTEGDIFYSTYCVRCIHERAFIQSHGHEDSCDILIDSALYDIEHPYYPKEWVWIAGEGACCNGFEMAPDATPPRCTKTIDLFGVTR